MKQNKKVPITIAIVSLIILSGLLSMGLILERNKVKLKEINPNFDCLIYNPQTDKNIRFGYNDTVSGRLNIIIPYTDYEEISITLISKNVTIIEFTSNIVSEEETLFRIDLFDNEIIESDSIIYIYIGGFDNLESISHILLEIIYTLG